MKPDKVDWDAEIKAALEKGKEVPEVTWVKPGEDEAMKVGWRLKGPLHSPCTARPCSHAILLAAERAGPVQLAK